LACGRRESGGSLQSPLPQPVDVKPGKKAKGSDHVREEDRWKIQRIILDDHRCQQRTQQQARDA